MVAIKYSLVASLLASSVVAAPAVQERSLDAQAQVFAIEQRDIEERTLLPIIMLLKLIQNTSIRLSGANSLIGSLNINGQINSPGNALITISKAIEHLSQAIPQLIIGLQGNIDMEQINIWAPGINTIVDLTVQVVNQLIVTVSQILPNNPSDQQIIQIITLLNTSKQLVIQLNGSLNTIVTGNIDFGKDKLPPLLPNIENATNQCKKCKNKQGCNKF
ncbi:hypothetical protein CJU90_3946 [Yarrowia sp. C11]|nr:hypothetical protein CKK34_5558 [Yarrowia sp. E02]KAG5367645.1 hypothetical protein CJU90_3946 [Yarrowia sp. C11]